MRPEGAAKTTPPRQRLDSQKPAISSTFLMIGTFPRTSIRVSQGSDRDPSGATALDKLLHGP
jgi:hypothetical protein